MSRDPLGSFVRLTDSDFIYFLGRWGSPRYGRRYVPIRQITETLYAILRPGRGRQWASRPESSRPSGETVQARGHHREGATAGRDVSQYRDPPQQNPERHDRVHSWIGATRIAPTGRRTH